MADLGLADGCGGAGVWTPLQAGEGTGVLPWKIVDEIDLGKVILKEVYKGFSTKFSNITPSTQFKCYNHNLLDIITITNLRQMF